MADGLGLRPLRGRGEGAAFRGCRFTQPPANGWQAFGLAEIVPEVSLRLIPGK
jgi:hypothetical protein